jgi:hypothetical protein
VGEAAVVVVLAVPLLQLAPSVAQRVLLLLRLLPFLPFQQRPRLPILRMRMRELPQLPEVEAAVQDVVVVVAEEVEQLLLQQRQHPVQRCRSLFIALVRSEL